MTQHILITPLRRLSRTSLKAPASYHVTSVQFPAACSDYSSRITGASLDRSSRTALSQDPGPLELDKKFPFDVARSILHRRHKQFQAAAMSLTYGLGGIGSFLVLVGFCTRILCLPLVW
jgi:hypothetical protein